LVQASISHSLHQAASAELAKSSYSGMVSEDDILHDAEKAFEALATLLGDREWLFGERGPSMLDASLFAYTHLLLDSSMAWRESRLGEMVMKHGVLVRHQERVLDRYF
jgi:metaxin